MSPKKIESASFILIFAGVGCFVLSLLAMGLAPWTSLRHVTAPLKKKIANPYYDKEGNLNSVGRGRDLYIKEGCWHCHSQFVRPVAGEPYRYGPASQAWESMYDVPNTFGTRRVGPDLSREAGRRSNDWHFAHLYNPRFTTPESIMPGYPWFFDKGPDGIKPKQQAEDLVAYMQALGFSFKDEIQAIVYPKVFKVAGAPDTSQVNLKRGQTLFKQNCIGCHGIEGNGLGKAYGMLAPTPANLVDRYISPSEAYSILSRGVLGSSMPSFREMSERDLWSMAIYVSKLGQTTKKNELAFLDPTRVQKGQELYQANCSACHGITGAGDGPAAAALNPRPKDFTRRIFAVHQVKRILKNGIAGSTMQAFSQFSDDQMEDLSHFLKSLYKEGL